MSRDNNTFSNWLKPEEVNPETEVEYLVIDIHDCFYTAFLNPLGFEGWKDIASDKHLQVVLYHELPDAETVVNTFK